MKGIHPLSNLFLVSKIVFMIIICFALAVKPFKKALNYSVSENFQSALDSFHKQYGFPGATAAYVLRDVTAGTAETGLADIESCRPMTTESGMLSASIGFIMFSHTPILSFYTLVIFSFLHCECQLLLLHKIDRSI